jgi:hypothetical protein
LNLQSTYLKPNLCNRNYEINLDAVHGNRYRIVGMPHFRNGDTGRHFNQEKPSPRRYSI